jgi:O-antigen ligase
LIHFFTNALCFYLGLLGLGPIKDLRGFWTGLVAGFALVLLSGWQQHFGGLQATREIFWSEIYPQLNDSLPAEWIKRMSSDRIFATLFYPNTLAGAVLLLTPASVWGLRSVLASGPGRRIILALVLVLAAGCLLWSGSKAGWLLALVLGLVAMCRIRIPLRLKLGFMIGVVLLGSAGFAWKYSDYLRKGAPSTVARLDYWEAALKTANAHPVLGTGPGTFGSAYAEIKRPESEMAKLTHNDFLQQASDSGWPGFILFAAFVAAVVAYPSKRVWHASSGGPFWVWLGVLGIWLQSMVEFGLYIPALSWPTMTFMGWLLVATNPLDNRDSTNLTSSRK